MAENQQLGSIPRDVRRVSAVASSHQENFFRKQLNDNAIRQLLREDGMILCSHAFPLVKFSNLAV